MAIFAEVIDNECINGRQWHPNIKGDNLTILHNNWKTTLH